MKEFPIAVTTSQPAPSTCTDAEPFALQVTDASMEPEFARGCVVIIDPTGQLQVGAYVLAHQQDEWSLGQLTALGAGYGLTTLAAGARAQAISTDEIRGVVTQRAGRRRSYFKRYE
jgi:DNA polymerase V